MTGDRGHRTISLRSPIDLPIDLPSISLRSPIDLPAHLVGRVRFGAVGVGGVVSGDGAEVEHLPNKEGGRPVRDGPRQMAGTASLWWSVSLLLTGRFTATRGFTDWSPSGVGRRRGPAGAAAGAALSLGCPAGCGPCGSVPRLAASLVRCSLSVADAMAREKFIRCEWSRAKAKANVFACISAHISSSCRLGASGWPTRSRQSSIPLCHACASGCAQVNKSPLQRASNE